MILTLTTTDAVLAATAALANCSRDLPSLCGAHLAITDDGKLEVLATDRYTVSRHRIPLQRMDDRRLRPIDARRRDERPEEGLDVIIPRAALQWLAKNARTYSRTQFGGVVRLDVQAEEWTAPSGKDRFPVRAAPAAGVVTITVAPIIGSREQVAATFELIGAKFPPVDTLIDKAVIVDGPGAPLSINASLLVRIDRSVPKDVAIRIEFTAPEGGARGAGAGAVKWSAPDLHMEGLIQPNRVL